MSDKPNRSSPLTATEIVAMKTTLEKYEEELDVVESRITMRGKSLAEAQKEQTAWPIFYALKRAELGAIVKRTGARVAAIRGRLHRAIKENISNTSSERQIEKYIDAHEDFLCANELLLYVEEVYKKYNEVLDHGFDKRGFALRDITQARIHDIHNEVL